MLQDTSTLIQYLFLDIVKFTQGRTTEAQVDIIQTLNESVRGAIEQHGLEEADRILLPTGDGMAIAILRTEAFDRPLKIALSIISQIKSYNEGTTDHRRRFEVRMGINQNIDNLVIDVNGSRSVAGRGINMAHRVMSQADGMQVMVSEAVFDILREREAYENSFRAIPGRDKHGNQFQVFQFIRDDSNGLNTDLPLRLKQKPFSARTKMGEYQAHFIANAVRYSDFFMTNRKATLFHRDSVITLHLLTLDSTDNFRRNPLQERKDRANSLSSGGLQSKYTEITKSEFWTRVELADAITDKLPLECFEQADSFTAFWAFPSDEGKRRAQEEHPEIWSYVLDESN